MHDLADVLATFRDPRRFVWLLRAMRVDFAKRRQDAESLYMAHEHFNRFDEMRKMGSWVDFYAQVDQLISAAFAVAEIGAVVPLNAAVTEAVNGLASRVTVASSTAEHSAAPSRTSVADSSPMRSE